MEGGWGQSWVLGVREAQSEEEKVLQELAHTTCPLLHQPRLGLSPSLGWLHQDHMSPQVSEHRCGGVGMNRLCWGLLVTPQSEHPLTCTPRMPKMIKKAQQMSTMLPMGLREEMSVSTTSFKPGARLMTLQAGKERWDTVSQQRDIPNSAHSHQAS